MIAPWKAPSLQVELLETASLLNSSSFLSLFEVTLRDMSNEQANDKAIIDKFVSAKPFGYFTAAEKSLFQLNLAMRSATPRIEAYFHYYEKYVDVSSMKEKLASCGSWILLSKTVICNVDQLKNSWNLLSSHDDVKHRVLPFDHIYGELKNDTPIVIFYVDLSDHRTSVFYQTLLSQFEERKFKFIIRWKPMRKNENLQLSGFGVELKVKSTEYKVSDDQFSDKGDVDVKPAGQEPDLIFGHDFDYIGSMVNNEEKLSEYREFLTELMQETTPSREDSGLDKDLAFKFIHVVMKSPVPLHSLKYISQDIPKYLKFLNRVETSTETMNVIRKSSQEVIQKKGSDIYINGIGVDVDKIDSYSLLNIIKIESQSLDRLKAFGLSSTEAASVMKQAFARDEQPEASQEAYDLHYDMGRKSDPTIWWNNVEKDSKYSSFSRSINSIIQYMGGRGIPRIRKNLYNAIFAVDLNSKLGLDAINWSIKMISSNVPIRFGMLPLIRENDSISEKITRCLYFIIKNVGKKQAAEFIETLHGKLSQGDLTEAHLQQLFLNITKKTKNGTSGDYGALVYSAEINDYINILGVKLNQFCLNIRAEKEIDGYLFINGAFFDLDDTYQQQISSALEFFVASIQQAVFQNGLSDDEDVYAYFLKLFGAKKIRNPFLFPNDKRPLRVLELDQLSSLQLSNIPYVTNSDHGASYFTIWFVGKSSNHTYRSVIHILKYLSSRKDLSGKVRLAVNIDGKLSDESLDPDFDQHWEFNVNGKKLSYKSFGSFLNDLHSNELSPLMPHEGFALYVNGRHVGPFPLDYTLNDMAVKYLVDYEHGLFKQSIFEGLDSRLLVSDKILQIAVTLYHSAIIHKRGSYFGISKDMILKRDNWFDQIGSDKIACSHGSPDDNGVEIVALIDPLSEKSQKISHMLSAFSEALDFLRIKVLFHVETAVDQMTKKYYRYSAASKILFDDKGMLSPIPAVFNNLPVEILYSLDIDSPRSWVVMQYSSEFDLDNLRLQDVKRGEVEAIMQLKYLLVEGHAQDQYYKPPRGLQLILGYPEKHDVSDTIVMANLGYYQLKALPGVWSLRIRDERSKEFYDLLSVEHYDDLKNANEGEIESIIDSFHSVLLITKVYKRPEKRFEELLDDQDSGGSILSNNMDFNWFSQSGNKHGHVNVFSVASGHLYERFLRIMILSVMKQTKGGVKFWFIENFLSPMFKDFIPEMAKELKFQYELVTYKWPVWLRDVLFPLSLDKVIFVDADQIVRTDLKELVDIDLKGAPYGYTPFCNSYSREETSGFRFWNSGYWKSHLQGKPYHISALYVVDLKRFRAIAAGDRLRQQYQMLSADPNSLANLDQDLPNYMQHSLPIHSLPEEWLWCETWCDDSSLKKAKTIDLCNNPLTKEPKLDRARRLLPEWSVYDKEQKEMYTRWKKRHFKAQILHDEL